MTQLLMRHFSRISVACAIFAGLGFAEATDKPPSSWKTKLDFHADNVYSPMAVAGALAWAGYLQARNSPREWSRDEDAYFDRLGSTLAYLGVRQALGFGLDAALHQDPRYYKSSDTGTWRRIGHVFRGTILTHKDSGGETLATWRFGSAYGAAFLSNEWQPGRLNNVHEGLEQGTAQLGFDVLTNLKMEFWPDVKKKLFRR